MPPLDDRRGARLGTYRVLSMIEDEEAVATVLALVPGFDIYRSHHPSCVVSVGPGCPPEMCWGSHGRRFTAPATTRAANLCRAGASSRQLADGQTP
jgi:hypothetical protein